MEGSWGLFKIYLIVLRDQKKKLNLEDFFLVAVILFDFEGLISATS